MVAYTLIAARVTPETKAAFRALAQREQLTESALLMQLLGILLRGAGTSSSPATKRVPVVSRDARLTVRLQADDQGLLRERAASWNKPPATYVSMLVRAHLRSLAPLRSDELTALQRTVSELKAIGRNLNQIARLGNQSGRVTGPARDDLRAMLKVSEGLRDHVQGIVEANATSWRVGHASTNR
jgi:hypothetical protein